MLDQRLGGQDVDEGDLFETVSARDVEIHELSVGVSSKGEGGRIEELIDLEVVSSVRTSENDLKVLEWK